MQTYKMLIDGKWVNSESGNTFPVFNPANGEEFARVSLGSKADVDKAVAAARKAFPIWSEKSPEERARILKEIAAIIRKHTQELIDIDILDHGSPVGAANAFVSIIPGLFEEAAELSKTFMKEGDVHIVPGMIPFLRREPIGVVACIVPWNAAGSIAAMKLAPALATGNTCVVKPASLDCLEVILLAKIMSECAELPPGVVNVVTGPGGTVGAALGSHPDVGMISFTGSCETGKELMASASKTVKPLIMELGGKNPFIVLEDADLDLCVAGGVESLFFNTGMICGSPGRFYVAEKLHDKFVEKFVELTKKIVVGDPSNPKTTMGPVVSAEHKDKVENYINIGVQEGAKIAFRGKKPSTPTLDKGYFVEPVVFTNVTQDMRIAREEIFGPVAVIMKYPSEEKVIEMANDNTFGLTASVWTQDYQKAVRFASKLQAGNVEINCHGPASGLPRGGVKESGFGREGGIYGLQEYTQLKGICINMAGPSHRRM